MALEFLRNGKHVIVDSFSPDTMLLGYLRRTEKATGTKEGCNEGDCGACTIVLGQMQNGKLIYKAVNACILFLGQVHGCEVLTIEDLKAGDALHPIQQAMVECNASQCGFCTPGIVMSLFALAHSGKTITRDEIIVALAGNLCRCTGYKPIIDAAMQSCQNLQDQFSAKQAQTIAALQNIADADLHIGNAETFFASPATAQSLANLSTQNPTALIVSGATDVGLWVNKKFKPQNKIIYTGRAAGFAEISDEPDKLIIGAGATYAQSLGALVSLAPDIGETVKRIGSVQVRNSGTIGGNIANGSPIGDMPPMLIALGATLILRHREATRQMPLEDFFIAYGKQDRNQGELVWQIEIPKLKRNQHFKAFKISKRFDQDISAVIGGFMFTIEGQTITDARIAFGGMAATPLRAITAEKNLIGKTLDEALRVKLTDYKPLSDMRASAEYRLEVSQNLLTKALLEMQGETQSRVLTRVLA